MIRRTNVHLIMITLFSMVAIIFINGHNILANLIVQDVNDSLEQALKAYDDFDLAKDDYTFEWTQLIVLDAHLRALTVSFNSNKSAMRKEAIKLASDAIPTSWDFGDNIKDTAANAAIISISYADEVSLQKALVSKTLEMQKKVVDVSKDYTKMDNAYKHYVAHINAFNAANKRNKISESANVDPTPKGKIPSGENGVNTNLSVNCSNPKCNTVYTVGNVHPADSTQLITLDNVVGLSESRHWVTCEIPHIHSSNPAVEPQNFNEEAVGVIAQYIGLWRPKLILSS